MNLNGAVFFSLLSTGLTQIEFMLLRPTLLGRRPILSPSLFESNIDSHLQTFGERKGRMKQVLRDLGR